MWFHVLFRFVADSFWFGIGVLLLFDVAFGLVYERACTRRGVVNMQHIVVGVVVMHPCCKKGTLL